jgi:hypothetical protein
MIKVIFGSWKNIILTIIIILLIICIILLVVGGNTLTTITNGLIDSLPIFIPENNKNDLKKFINKLINSNIYIIPTEITKEIVRYVPNKVLRSMTDGLPADVITEEKCKRIIKDKSFLYSQNYPPENLPCDDKIDHCKNDNFDIEDIDLNQVIFASNTKQKKVKTYLY